MAINGFGNNNLYGNKKLVTQQPTVAAKPGDVESKAKQPEEPKLKLSAVWNADGGSDGNWRKGDIVVGKNGYFRVQKVNGDGTYKLVMIERNDIKSRDFEHDRGNYSPSDFINGSF